jgi:hypothetical protein
LSKVTGCAIKRSKKNLAKLLEDTDFTDEEDQFILNSLYKYGYGNWELIKVDIRNYPAFRFNWRFLSKTINDIRRRCDYLLEVFKEQQEEIQKPPLKKTRSKPTSNPVPAKPKLKSHKSKSSVIESEDDPMNNSRILSSSDTKGNIMSSSPEPSQSNKRQTRNRKVNYKET